MIADLLGDWFGRFLLLLLATLFALMGFAIHASIKSNDECKARGGQKIHDGTFTVVWLVTDYKTGMGFMNHVPNFKCSVPETAK